MKRIVLTFGGISGAIVVAGMYLASTLVGEGEVGSEFFGYLSMIVALGLIFVGVKQYRDRDLGGVIKFWTAVSVGLGISAVAGVIYVVGWELYLSLTDYAFIGDYARGVLEARAAEGASAAELAAEAESMAVMTERYGNPAYRLPITFLEIFPVGVLISLISGAVLRNSHKVDPREALV